jgi:hypothetical protein
MLCVCEVGGYRVGVVGGGVSIGVYLGRVSWHIRCAGVKAQAPDMKYSVLTPHQTLVCHCRGGHEGLSSNSDPC